jgi:hypothetical protein
MSYPEILLTEDYDGVRSLLGLTDLDLTDGTIDQPPFGPAGEAWVTSRVTDWSTILTPGQGYDAARHLMLRIACAYAAAAYIAETYVQGGTVGLVSFGTQSSRDWPKLASGLWGRASETVANLVDEVKVQVEYDLVGQKISGPSRAYYEPLYGTEWWKYPPVYRADLP